jgi:hypothetical protein
MMGWAVGVALVALILMLVADEVQRRRFRRRFLSSRLPMPEEAFCDEVSAVSPMDRLIWGALRSAIAQQCRITAEAIRPDDELDTLCRMTFDGWDYLDVLFRLGLQLGIRIRHDQQFPPRDGPPTNTFREFGELLVAHLRHVMAHQASAVERVGRGLTNGGS